MIHPLISCSLSAANCLLDGVCYGADGGDYDEGSGDGDGGGDDDGVDDEGGGGDGGDGSDDNDNGDDGDAYYGDCGAADDVEDNIR